jgi:hypothetical protein
MWKWLKNMRFLGRSLWKTCVFQVEVAEKRVFFRWKWLKNVCFLGRKGWKTCVFQVEVADFLPPRNLTLNTWGLAFWLPSLAWSSLAKPFPSCHCLIIAARSRWCSMCHTQWPFATTHTGHMLTMSPGTPYLI